MDGRILPGENKGLTQERKVHISLRSWRLPLLDAPICLVGTCCPSAHGKETVPELTTEAKQSLAKEMRVITSLKSASEGYILQLFLLEMSKYY